MIWKGWLKIGQIGASMDIQEMIIETVQERTSICGHDGNPLVSHSRKNCHDYRHYDLHDVH